MSKKHTHLSLVQSYQIQSFLKVGMKQNVIEQEIGVHPSAISQELSPNTANRGRTAGVYKAERAQNKAKQRRHYKPKQVEFTFSMKEQAAKWLIEEKWSSEIISVVGHRLVISCIP